MSCWFSCSVHFRGLVYETSNYIVCDCLSCDVFSRCYVEFPCVFDVERWLEVFGHNVALIVLTCHSPNSHLSIHVILTDCVMASVY